MTTTNDVDWAALEVIPTVGKTPKAEPKKFPCEHCGGSGIWRGGVNRHGNSKCSPCKGRGWFLLSRQDRLKKRSQAKQNKTKRVHEAAVAIQEANPGLFEDLASMVSWNEFAKSLMDQWMTKGTLSDKQITAAKKMIAKVEATKAERARVEAENTVTVDLSPIREMFERAVESGYKRPKYRAAGLVISRAPDTGKNAGALYVKGVEGADEYQGKITENVFYPVRSADTSVPALLQAIAADPKGEAVKWGNKTGSCSCCGRELTKKESIDAGIGPICATRWFS